MLSRNTIPKSTGGTIYISLCVCFFLSVFLYLRYYSNYHFFFPFSLHNGMVNNFIFNAMLPLAACGDFKIM